eukprot:NODE_266_length_12318_cov_0.301498.p3 type:complete len:419 gc:universal NODE_266_length_12318_cov_0.301498:5123-3867(-)
MRAGPENEYLNTLIVFQHIMYLIFIFVLFASGSSVTKEQEKCDTEKLFKSLGNTELPAIRKLVQGCVIDYEAQFGDKKSTILHEAINVALDKDIVVLFISEDNKNIQDSLGQTPLHLALECRSDPDLITLLVTPKNIKLLGGTMNLIPYFIAFQHATYPRRYRRPLKLSHFILNKLNPKIDCAVIDCAQVNNETLRLFKALKARKPNQEVLDILQKNYWNPLYWILKITGYASQDSEVGIDLYALDENGHTLARVARDFGYDFEIQSKLRNRFTLDLFDFLNRGSYFADEAIQLSKFNCVDLDAVDHLGNTPLFVALQSCHTEYLLKLLCTDTNVQAINSMGWTPYLKLKDMKMWNKKDLTLAFRLFPENCLIPFGLKRSSSSIAIKDAISKHLCRNNPRRDAILSTLRGNKVVQKYI